MTEDEYILVSDLANLHNAKQTLKAINLTNNELRLASLAIQKQIVAINRKLEID